MKNNNNLESILKNSTLRCNDPRVERLKAELREKRDFFSKAVPIFYKDLVDQYSFFRTNIYNPKRVLYPCCGIDASLIPGFPDSEVTFVDVDEEVVNIMRNNGIPIIMEDIIKYNPKVKNDLIVILNPVMSSKHLIKGLTDEGYVLSNDYHGNASYLIKKEDFEFLGTMDRNKNGDICFNNGDKSKLGRFVDYFHIFKKK